MAAVGWGATKEKRTARTLQLAAKLPILGTDTCEMILEGTLDEHMICAGGVGMDTCRGELGCLSRRPSFQIAVYLLYFRRFGRSVAYSTPT